MKTVFNTSWRSGADLLCSGQKTCVAEETFSVAASALKGRSENTVLIILTLKGYNLILLVFIALVAVNGGWSEWSQLSLCDKGCGGGKQKRYRFCNQPILKHGGADCVGSRTETKGCNVDACPGLL